MFWKNTEDNYCVEQVSKIWHTISDIWDFLEKQLKREHELQDDVSKLKNDLSRLQEQYDKVLFWSFRVNDRLDALEKPVNPKKPVKRK